MVNIPDIKATIDNIKEIPTLPTIVGDLLTMVMREDCNARNLAEKISLDQSLTLKVLKVANSAYYGFQRRIHSVQDAIVILGFNEIKGLVLTISVLDMFGGFSSQYFNRNNFWKHSLAVATTAEILSEKSTLRFPEAFVAGLLHDVGKVILDHYFNDIWGEIVMLMQSESLHSYEAELKVFEKNITHATVGYWVVEKWNLPSHLAESIRYHHSLNKMGEDTLLTAIVYASNVLVYQWEPNLMFEPTTPELNHDVAKLLNITDDNSPGLFEELNKRFELRKEVLNIL